MLIFVVLDVPLKSISLIPLLIQLILVSFNLIHKSSFNLAHLICQSFIHPFQLTKSIMTVLYPALDSHYIRHYALVLLFSVAGLLSLFGILIIWLPHSQLIAYTITEPLSFLVRVYGSLEVTNYWQTVNISIPKTRRLTYFISYAINFFIR